MRKYSTRTPRGLADARAEHLRSPGREAQGCSRVRWIRMKRFERSTTINAPAEKVFAYVSDFTRHGEWGGHGLAVTQDGDGPTAVGSTFSTTAKNFGTQREKSTITEMNPPKEFGWDSVGALGRGHHWFALSEGSGATTGTKGAAI